MAKIYNIYVDKKNIYQGKLFFIKIKIIVHFGFFIVAL
jgi:hypothetical protein